MGSMSVSHPGSLLEGNIRPVNHDAENRLDLQRAGDVGVEPG